jgi:hypothetical protein
MRAVDDIVAMVEAMFIVKPRSWIGDARPWRASVRQGRTRSWQVVISVVACTAFAFAMAKN